MYDLSLHCELWPNFYIIFSEKNVTWLLHFYWPTLYILSFDLWQRRCSPSFHLRTSCAGMTEMLRTWHHFDTDLTVIAFVLTAFPCWSFNVLTTSFRFLEDPTISNMATTMATISTLPDFPTVIASVIYIKKKCTDASI